MKKCKLIILIDDEDLENFVNKKLIEKLDITEDLKIFKNGFEGMNYLRILSQVDKIPDLVFLDLNMPIMDGFEFLNHFKKLPSHTRDHVKVIVLTSSLNEKDFEMAKSLGCHGYLIKPLTKEKIREGFDRIFTE